MYNPNDPMYRAHLVGILTGRRPQGPMANRMPMGQQPYAQPQTQYPGSQPNQTNQINPITGY